MDKKQQILLINDIAGYGKVATAAMLPILSYFGYSTYSLPTLLVSNTLDYGKFNMLDTTDYIKGVFPVWKELGFHFDAIATGLLASARQADYISRYCKEQTAVGTPIFVDPIMGDEGKLYNGMTMDSVRSMREMLSVADLCYPNYTEACLLTGRPYQPEGVDQATAKILLDHLRKLGARSVLITSISIDGQTCVCGYNARSKSYFTLPYTEIPVHFPGTGDIFSAVLIRYLLDSYSLEESTQKAMNAVWKLIDLNKDNVDRNHGIPIERYLNIL
ncbi:MAG: pyridoxamine kinase [Prevotella sp.]|jgi:pyridoxine kinase|nr:pyridoxamine kinase [Prevotella sp.]MCH4181987.1 pyridoxamine kinase [Prevotella sp.]MCH4212287.1 pyridoxamine kinase [Prevotella sp.]MCH4242078.1 pyridoxamine kinase [Prevotella sp.]